MAPSRGDLRRRQHQTYRYLDGIALADSLNKSVNLLSSFVSGAGPDTAGSSLTIELYNQLQDVKRLVKERHDRGQACIELYLPVVSVVNTLLRWPTSPSPTVQDMSFQVQTACAAAEVLQQLACRSSRLAFAVVSALNRCDALALCSRQLANATLHLSCSTAAMKSDEGDDDAGVWGTSLAQTLHMSCLTLAPCWASLATSILSCMHSCLEYSYEAGAAQGPGAQGQGVAATVLRLSRELEAAVADSHLYDHLARTYLASLSAMETTGSLSPAAAAAVEGLLVQLTDRLHFHLQTASKRLAWRAPGTVEPLWGPPTWRPDLYGSCMQHLVLVLGLYALRGLDGGEMYGMPDQGYRTQSGRGIGTVPGAVCQEEVEEAGEGGPASAPAGAGAGAGAGSHSGAGRCWVLLPEVLVNLLSLLHHHMELRLERQQRRRARQQQAATTAEGHRQGAAGAPDLRAAGAGPGAGPEAPAVPREEAGPEAVTEPFLGIETAATGRAAGSEAGTRPGEAAGPSPGAGFGVGLGAAGAEAGQGRGPVAGAAPSRSWHAVGPSAVFDISARVANVALRSAHAWRRDEGEQAACAGAGGLSGSAGGSSCTDIARLARRHVAPLALHALATCEAAVSVQQAQAARRQRRGPGGREAEQRDGEAGGGQGQPGGSSLVRWLRLSYDVAWACMRWSDRQHVDALAARLAGALGEAPAEDAILDSEPPPPLAAALAAGHVPFLERLLRRAGRLRHRADLRLCRTLLRPESRAHGPKRYSLVRLLPYNEPKSVASLVVTMCKLLERAVFAVDGRQQEAVKFATALVTAACGVVCQGIEWLDNCAPGATGGGGGGECGDPSTAASFAPAAPGGVQGDNGRSNSCSSGGVEGSEASSSSSSSGGCHGGTGGSSVRSGASSHSAAAAPTQAAAYAQLQAVTSFAAAELLPRMLRLSAAVRTLAAFSPTPVPAAGIMAAVSPAVVVVVWEVTAAVLCSRTAGGEGADGAAAAAAGASGASGAARGGAGRSWSGLLFPPGVECELVSLLGINLLGLETSHAENRAAGQGVCMGQVVSVCARLAEAFPEQVRAAVERMGGNDGGRAWSPGVMLRVAGRARNRGDHAAAEHAVWLARRLAGWGAAAAGEGSGGRGGPAREGSSSMAPVPSTLLLCPAAAAAIAFPVRRCGYGGCANLAGDSEAELQQGLKPCGGCAAVWYCSRECQAAHWREGHRAACGAAAQAQSGGDSARTG